MAFGHVAKNGKYFANPQIGRKYDEGLPDLKAKTEDEDGEPTVEAKVVHITKKDDGGHHVEVEHEDGTSSEHEVESLEELKDKLDQFFNEEIGEFKKDPEGESEYHKGSLGDAEEEDNPFTSSMKNMFRK